MEISTFRNPSMSVEAELPVFKSPPLDPVMEVE
jgi:hypothetical protein